MLATRGENSTPSPRTTADAERSSHSPGISKPSLRASTPASFKRESAQSTARRLAAEPVGRPPTSSTSACRSLHSGVSPRNAAVSRAASSRAASGDFATGGSADQAGVPSRDSDSRGTTQRRTGEGLTAGSGKGARQHPPGLPGSARRPRPPETRRPDGDRSPHRAWK